MFTAAVRSPRHPIGESLPPWAAQSLLTADCADVRPPQLTIGRALRAQESGAGEAGLAEEPTHVGDWNAEATNRRGQ